MSTNQKMLLSALAYAEVFSWSVFPLLPSAKIPNGKLVPNGFKQATTDSHLIREWWTQYPKGNIGLVTGEQFIVVDVDPRSNGDKTLATLEAIHGKLPNTPTATTGGGGAHILFYMPKGEFKYNKTLDTGIDIKAQGGYIVAAPSIHPSGALYEWEPFSHPARTKLAKLPQWIFDKISKKAYKSKPIIALDTCNFLHRCFELVGFDCTPQQDGTIFARCPWHKSHSSPTGLGEDSSTVILPPTESCPTGRLYCHHAGCSNRTTAEAIRMFSNEIIFIAGKENKVALKYALKIVEAANLCYSIDH